MLEEDEEAKAAVSEGIRSTVDFLNMITGRTVSAPSDESLNPVEQARNLYTGVNAGTQDVITSQDMMQQLQDMADFMTTTVDGGGRHPSGELRRRGRRDHQ